MTAISVTAEHIAKGEPENRERCPVALAIMDALPNATAIEVTGTLLSISHGEQFFTTRLPPKASEFVRDFDDSEPVQPFTFDLDYPAVTR